MSTTKSMNDGGWENVPRASNGRFGANSETEKGGSKEKARPQGKGSKSYGVNVKGKFVSHDPQEPKGKGIGGMLKEAAAKVGEGAKAVAEKGTEYANEQEQMVRGRG